MFIKRVFVDIDCVLADFVRGVADVMGIPHDVLLAHWTPGQYGFGHAVAAGYRHLLPPTYISDDEANRTFWKLVEGRCGFWSDLQAFPWSDAVVGFADGMDPNYRFLTSPSDCGYCLVGKHRWLKQQGYDPARMIPTRHKADLAAPGRLLIDDHEINCTAWEQQGGTAILFPALHNARHAERDRAWEVVKLELETLLHKGAT